MEGRFWLVMVPYDLGVAGTYELYDDSDESPISDDEGVFQFHVEFVEDNGYPRMKVIE